MTRLAPGPLAQEAALLAAALRDLLAHPAAHAHPTDHAGDAGHTDHAGDAGHTDHAGDAGHTDHAGEDDHAGPGRAGSGFRSGSPSGGGGGGGGGGSGCGCRPGGHHDIRPDDAGMTLCQVCPVCRLVATLAAGRPEVAVHLFTAATSLAAAVRAILAGRPDAGGDGVAADGAGPVDDTAMRGRTTERPGSRSRVQRIDVE